MTEERRRSKRISFSSSASIVSAGKTYAGLIQNVSGEGVEYLLTSLNEVSKDFIPDKSVNLIILDPSGKQYSLNCEVKWYLRKKDKSSALTLGMKITNPPSQYRELISSLTTGKKK